MKSKAERFLFLMDVLPILFDQEKHHGSLKGRLEETITCRVELERRIAVVIQALEEKK